MRTHLLRRSGDRVRDVLDEHVDEAGRRAEELAEDDLEQRADVHLVRRRLEEDVERGERPL